jgi:hypothetical protein
MNVLLVNPFHTGACARDQPTCQQLTLSLILDHTVLFHSAVSSRAYRALVHPSAGALHNKYAAIH